MKTASEIQDMIQAASASVNPIETEDSLDRILDVLWALNGKVASLEASHKASAVDAYGTALPFNFGVATEPMTMRDIFAAHALSECIRIACTEESVAESAAKYAYEFADAMLKARKQPGAPPAFL